MQSIAGVSSSVDSVDPAILSGESSVCKALQGSAVQWTTILSGESSVCKALQGSAVQWTTILSGVYANFAYTPLSMVVH